MSRTIQKLGEVLPGPEQVGLVDVPSKRATKGVKAIEITFRNMAFVPAEHMRADDVLTYVPTPKKN